jgi:two-component system, NarL family, nitrate/nitrite response regulator NarL
MRAVGLKIKTMKFLIVDDHPVVRHGLGILLQQNEPDAAILLAMDAEEGLHIAESNDDLDAVLLDLSMPGTSGMQAIEEFGKRNPALPVIVISSSEDPDDVRRALALGALGYVPKSAGPHTILSALRLVLSGEVYIPALMLLSTAAAAENPIRHGGPSAINQLTDRQVEVLKLLAGGLQNKEIAYALGLAEKTVKTHVSAIFKTLRVINRTQAASLAREASLV